MNWRNIVVQYILFCVILINAIATTCSHHSTSEKCNEQDIQEELPFNIVERYWDKTPNCKIKFPNQELPTRLQPSVDEQIATNHDGMKMYYSIDTRESPEQYHNQPTFIQDEKVVRQKQLPIKLIHRLPQVQQRSQVENTDLQVREYSRNTFKTILIALLPNGLLKLDYLIGSAFRSTLLEIFNSILPRVSLYNYELKQVQLSLQQKEYPQTITINRTSDDETTNYDSNLEAKHMNEYMQYWQGVISAGIFLAFTGLIICGLVSLFTLFMLCNGILSSCCKTQNMQTKIISSTNPGEWMKNRKLKLQKRKIARIYTCLLSTVLFIMLIIWGIFAFHSTIAISASIENLSTQEQSMADAFSTALLDTMNGWNNSTLIVEEQVQDIKIALLSTVPDDTTVSNYKNCINNFITLLPNVSSILSYVANVTNTINEIPDITTMILEMQQIEFMATNAHQLLYDTSENINSTLQKLESLSSYMETLVEELNIFNQSTSQFPPVSNITEILEGLSDFENIFDTQFTSSYISNFESKMDSNSFSIGLFTIGNIILELDQITNAILDAKIESIVTYWNALKLSLDALHSDETLISVSTQLSMIFDSIQIQDFATQIVTLETNFLTLNQTISSFSDKMSILSFYMDSVQSISYLQEELLKLSDAMSFKECVESMTNDLANINASTVTLPSTLQELVDVYQNVESLLHSIDFTSIEGNFQQLESSFLTNYPTMKTEFQNFKLDAWRSGFPSQEDVLLNAMNMSQAFSDALDIFNISQIIIQIDEFNTSISQLPDMSSESNLYQELVRTLYDIKEIRSNGIDGPYLSLETIAQIFHDEQPTASDDGPCNSLCEDNLRSSPRSGGAGTGPTKNLIIVAFWTPGCGVPEVPHVWCYFKDAALNRPSTLDVINNLQSIQTSLDNIPSWESMIENVISLNSTIEVLQGLHVMSEQLISSSTYMQLSKPTFTTFQSNIEDLMSAMTTLNISLIDETIEMMENMYSRLENITALDTILEFRNNISKELNFEGYVSVFRNVSEGIQNKTSTFLQLNDETRNTFIDFHEELDKYDVFRQIVLLLHLFILLFAPVFLCNCCVSCCAMKKRYSKCICSIPLCLLLTACILSYSTLIVWLNVAIALPPNLVLKDFCTEYETHLWSTAIAFLKESKYATALENITSSNMNLEKSVELIDVYASVQNVNFTLSIRDVYDHFTKYACQSSTLAQLEEELRHISSNLTVVVDGIVSTLDSPDNFQLLDGFYQAYTSVLSDIIHTGDAAINQLFSSLDCESFRNLFLLSKETICYEIATSLSFHWGVYIIYSFIGTFAAIGYVIAYVCFKSTQIHDEYILLESDNEKQNGQEAEVNLSIHTEENGNSIEMRVNEDDTSKSLITLQANCTI